MLSTRYITVANVRFAYQLHGTSSSSTTPLVLLQHFRGNFTAWDPQYVQGLSSSRPVILVDYAGVGESSGKVRDSCLACARDIIVFVQALGYTSIDLLGFSIGGFVAQIVVLEAPTLVRKLILAGTGPSAGEGLESGPQELFMDFINGQTMEENKSIYLRAFYTPTPKQQEKAEEWWTRIHPSAPQFLRRGSDLYLDSDGTKAQVEAIVKWVSGAGTDGTPVKENEKSYERLSDIKCPVLVIAGKEDEVVPVANSILMWKKIKQARLLVMEDVGHGVLFGFEEETLTNIELFLDA